MHKALATIYYGDSIMAISNLIKAESLKGINCSRLVFHTKPTNEELTTILTNLDKLPNCIEHSYKDKLCTVNDSIIIYKGDINLICQTKVTSLTWHMLPNANEITIASRYYIGEVTFDTDYSELCKLNFLVLGKTHSKTITCSNLYTINLKDISSVEHWYKEPTETQFNYIAEKLGITGAYKDYIKNIIIRHKGFTSSNYVKNPYGYDLDLETEIDKCQALPAKATARNRLEDGSSNIAAQNIGRALRIGIPIDMPKPTTKERDATDQDLITVLEDSSSNIPSLCSNLAAQSLDVKHITNEYKTYPFPSNTQPLIFNKTKEETTMNNVYTVVIVQEPTIKEQEDGVDAKIALGPVTIVANDKASAGMVAAATDADFKQNSRMQVLVRPFLD